MKLSLPVLFTIGLGLAVAQAAAKLVGLLIILSMIVAVLTRPREMIALATTMGLLNLAALYPLPVLGLLGVLIAARCRLDRAASNTRWSRKTEREAPRSTKPPKA